MLFRSAGLLKVTLGKAQLDALVKNTGSIQADGGTVVLTAAAVGGLYNAVVNNQGQLRAQTLQNVEGRILLLADFDTGTVKAAGNVNASAPNGGDGGFVDTSAANVKIDDNFRVTTHAANGKTGTWLIDPTDFTIAAGGAAPTNSGIGASTLSNNLTNNTIAIQTVIDGTGNGDIFVNADVTWSSANTLSLAADRNIDFAGGGRLVGSNASSRVHLTAGSIIGSGSNIAVTAGTLAVQARNGIGGSLAPLLTRVQNLALQSSGRNGIHVTNTGNVTVAAASTGGDVVIRTTNGLAGVEAFGFGSTAGAGTAGGNITVGTVASPTGLNVGASPPELMATLALPPARVARAATRLAAPAPAQQALAGTSAYKPW